jgi:hypothetical protein
MNTNDLKLRHLHSISFRNVNATVPYPPTSTLRQSSAIGAISGGDIANSNHPSHNHLDTHTHPTEPYREAFVFFALYVIRHNTLHLIYVSEVIDTTVEAKSQPIQFPHLPWKLRNHHTFKISIWYNTSPEHQEDNWLLFRSDKIKLTNLRYICDSTQVLPDLIFKPNSVIIDLNGRLYGDTECVTGDISTQGGVKSIKPVAKSYTFDSIRELNSLVNCLQELIISKHKVASQITNLLQNLPKSPPNDLIELLISKEQTTVDDLNSIVLLYDLKINQIRHLSKQTRDTSQEKNQLQLIECQVDPLIESIKEYVFPLIMQELLQLGTIISEVFTIENVANSIEFSIMKVPFPSSIKEILKVCYYSCDDNLIDQINAGLSFIVQLMNCLADITNSFVQYPMQKVNHQWTIMDVLSAKPRRLPLKYDEATTEKIDTNPIKFMNPQFESGLALLTKNMSRLCSNIGNLVQMYVHHHQTPYDIPNDCPDNFLWNLQYLLLFLTAEATKTPNEE